MVLTDTVGRTQTDESQFEDITIVSRKHTGSITNNTQTKISGVKC